jgi:hypothetical protein
MSLSPEERAQDVERQVDEVLGPVFDEHLDKTEIALQGEMLRVGCALAELVEAAQAAREVAFHLSGRF